MALRSVLSRHHRALSSVSGHLSHPRLFPRRPAAQIPPPNAFAFPRRLSTAADSDAATGGVMPPARDPPERARTDAQSMDPEVLLPGCDFKHWLVFVDPPADDTPRDDIIDSYVKMLAQAVGSEEEAKMKMYSVSTRYYFAFGAIIPREVCEKLKKMPGVRWVLPDSYLHPKTKDYGGEPFINGKAVPYDPKYHEVWLQNRQAPERSRRPDRRNFDRPRDNWQNREYQRQRPPMPNQNRDFENRPGPSPPNYGHQN